MTVITENLNAQLEALINTLAAIPATGQPGNASHYLDKLAHWVMNQGVDEPLAVAIWSQEDLDQVQDEAGEPRISRDQARRSFALIDRTHNTEIGINWDVLKCAIDSVQEEPTCN